MLPVMTCEDEPLLATDLAGETAAAGCDVAGLFHSSFDACSAADALATHLVELGCIPHSFVSKAVLPGMIAELTGSRQKFNLFTSTEPC